MKVLITAGGTGGHFYPAIALARELIKRNHQILFATRRVPLAIEVLQREKLEVTLVSCSPLLGKNPFAALKGSMQNIQGIFQGLRIIKTFKPDRVVGFGSYVSIPVVIAAFLKRVPVILHEQNVIPGWANRFSSRFAKVVAVSFEETVCYFQKGKAVVTGNPVRDDFQSATPEDSRIALGLKEDLKVILVFGGSAGARSINESIDRSLESLSDLKDQIQFLHLTGHPDQTKKLTDTFLKYKFHAVVKEFSHEMNLCYASADVVICRSGATTLAELIQTQIPAILVPYPYATNDHQRKNAQLLQEKGCGIMLSESLDLTVSLSRQIREWVLSPETLIKMRESYRKFSLSTQSAAKNLTDVVTREPL